MTRSFIIFYRSILLVLTIFFTDTVLAQNNLNRTVSINFKQIKLADLLTEIGKKAGFYFSYNSELIHTDSLINISVNNKPVNVLLTELFNDEVAYKEAPGYIILRPAPNRLKLLPDANNEPENILEISGYVLDDRSGKAVPYASVYERHLLQSTLTDERGFFRLKLKEAETITLTVSKEMYKDTSVNFLNKVTVTLKQRKYTYDADTGSVQTEKSWLGKLWISSRVKIQTANIGEFISGVPFQTSFVPGLGSHGSMTGQVIDHVSLNVLGGYNAGVNGLELGGLFNLNKQDAKYVQVAGLFNVVGGDLTGVQLGGLNNTVYHNTKGVQVAGIWNKVEQNLSGVQLAGIFNINSKTTTGLQVAGIFNKVGQNSTGLQLAGIANITNNNANGMQVAGIINKAKLQKGVQLALFNIADTLDGYAINLMSFSRNGYHQLSVYTDDNLINSIAFKTGNAKLYSKLTGGYHFAGDDKYYTCGIGFGHDFTLKNRWLLSTEFDSQLLRSYQWSNTHQLERLSVLLTIPMATKLSLFFGPSLNLYDVGQNNTIREQTALTQHKLALTGIGTSFKSWVGWSVGVSLL